eukprot:SAG11_NODE_219_length_12168_cov_5.600083_7_plen_59_part_00
MHAQTDAFEPAGFIAKILAPEGTADIVVGTVSYKILRASPLGLARSKDAMPMSIVVDF